MVSSNGYSFPHNALEQAQKTAKGWRELEQRLDITVLDIEDFEQLIEKATELSDKCNALREERSKIVAERNKILNEMWGHTKRIRNAAKSILGDDSPDMRALGLLPVNARRKK